MAIKLDKSACSIVVLCTDCPWWRGFALDRVEGWLVGRNHQARLHIGENQASIQLSQARKDARVKKM